MDVLFVCVCHAFSYFIPVKERTRAIHTVKTGRSDGKVNSEQRRQFANCCMAGRSTDAAMRLVAKRTNLKRTADRNKMKTHVSHHLSCCRPLVHVYVLYVDYILYIYTCISKLECSGGTHFGNLFDNCVVFTLPAILWSHSSLSHTSCVAVV